MDSAEKIYTVVTGNYKGAIEADLKQIALTAELEALQAEGLPVSVVKNADDYALLHAQAARRLQIVADRAEAIELKNDIVVIQSRYMVSQGLPRRQPFKVTVVTDQELDVDGNVIGETTADVFCRLRVEDGGAVLEHSLDGVTVFP